MQQRIVSPSSIAGLPVVVGSATVIAAEKGLSTLVLNKSQSGEVRLGDVIMPIYPERSAEMQFTPQNTGLLAGGRIIRIMGSINFAAKHSIVTVDRGRLQGAVVGQVLQIQATQLDDHKNNIELPAQTLGQLLVFNVFEQLSYAYILDSRLPIKIGAFLEVAQTAEK